jgi:hypothetical protein
LIQFAWVRPAAAAAGADQEPSGQIRDPVQEAGQRAAESKGPRAVAADLPGSGMAGGTPSAAPAGVAQSMPMPGAPQASGSPAMQFQGFADVSYHASSLPGTTNSFTLGQFNLFITSNLSDRLTVLAEAVLEADDRNAVEIDLERVLLQYAKSDYFNVAFGRYHTAIGWYNTAYHHSTWMQTAVGRPFLFQFEDEGGILPIHNVGVSASGRIPSGSLGLRYVAEVGNGRASRFLGSEPVQNAVDDNNGKSVNFALLARPARARGMEAGFSVYHDSLTPAGAPKVGQTILTAHLVYQTSKFEWLNEALVVRHAVSATDRATHTPGFYSQVSRKFGVVRPYFRYQYVNAPESDPVYEDVGRLHGPSAGLRYDFAEFAAFKVQYDRTERRLLTGFNSITLQVSFTF